MKDGIAWSGIDYIAVVFAIDWPRKLGVVLQERPLQETLQSSWLAILLGKRQVSAALHFPPVLRFVLPIEALALLQHIDKAPQKGTYHYLVLHRESQSPIWGLGLLYWGYLQGVKHPLEKGFACSKCQSLPSKISTAAFAFALNSQRLQTEKKCGVLKTKTPFSKNLGLPPCASQAFRSSLSAVSCRVNGGILTHPLSCSIGPRGFPNAYKIISQLQRFYNNTSYFPFNTHYNS